MERKCFRRPGLGPPTLYTFLLGVIFITLSSSRILLVKYSANEGELRSNVYGVLVSICLVFL